MLLYLQAFTPSSPCTAPITMYSLSININGSNSMIELVASNVSTFVLPSNIVSLNTQYDITLSAISDVGVSDSNETVSVSKSLVVACLLYKYYPYTVYAMCTSKIHFVNEKFVCKPRKEVIWLYLASVIHYQQFNYSTKD